MPASRVRARKQRLYRSCQHSDYIAHPGDRATLPQTTIISPTLVPNKPDKQRLNRLPKCSCDTYAVCMCVCVNSDSIAQRLATNKEQAMLHA
eukprot:15446620-Alexandrium_andersonii.AAC.1